MVVLCHAQLSYLIGQPSQLSQIERAQYTLFSFLFSHSFDPFSRSARSKSGGKAGIEKRKLQNKMRRETKGARKEIRADAAFIANLRAKQTRETDAYRKRKTKELLAGLGDQEGDFRKLQKKKKHMK